VVWQYSCRMAVRTALALVLLLVPAGGAAQGTRGHIAGTTLGESGAPIPGAFVTIRPGKAAAGPVELEVFSDESGRFRFDDIPPGTYRVAAHLFGFHVATSDVEVPAGRGADVALVMAAAPVAECVASFRPAVEFTTRRGEQLPAAYLTVMREGRHPRSYEVLPTGRPDPCFSPAAADRVSLDVFGYGEHVLKRAGEDPATVTWQVAIDPTPAARAGRTPPGPAQGQVRGRVFDVYAGSIPDASVRFQPVDPQSGLPEFGAVADARGRFDFEGVRTGTYRVTCRVRGYETSVAVHEVRPGVQNEVTLVMRAVK
jgi:hypothetical protein